MAAVSLTKANSGQSIEARQGDEIILRLPENPTTGYRWQIDGADGVEQETSEHTTDSDPPDPNPRLGKGGVQEFRFRAKEPGSRRLDLKHWREWEGERSVIEAVRRRDRNCPLT
jgi:inhibitor of cysteine peptidase